MSLHMWHQYCRACWVAEETVEDQLCVLATGGKIKELRKPKKQLNAKHVSTTLDEFKSQNIELDSNIFVYFLNIFRFVALCSCTTHVSQCQHRRSDTWLLRARVCVCVDRNKEGKVGGAGEENGWERGETYAGFWLITMLPKTMKERFC